MRHQIAGVRLSRTSAHRQALFSNLVAALFTHERIRTTLPKARETRRIAERSITVARRLGDVLAKKPEKRSDEEKARIVHAMRLVRRTVRDRDAVVKLFEEIGPRYLARRGGYTRIVKLGERPGDAAPMSLLELIPDEAPTPKEPKTGKGEGKAEAKPEGKSEKPAAKAKGEGAAKAEKPAKAKAEKKSAKKDDE